MHHIIDLSQADIVIGTSDGGSSTGSVHILDLFPYRLGIRQKDRKTSIFMGHTCSELDGQREDEVVFEELFKDLMLLSDGEILREIATDLFNGIQMRLSDDLSTVKLIVPFGSSSPFYNNLIQVARAMGFELAELSTDMSSLLMFCMEGNGTESRRLKRILSSEKCASIYIFDHRTADLRVSRTLCRKGSTTDPFIMKLVDLKTYNNLSQVESFSSIEKDLKEDGLDGKLAEGRYRSVYLTVGKEWNNSFSLKSYIQGMMEDLSPGGRRAVEIRKSNNWNDMELATRGAACIPNRSVRFEYDIVYGVQLDKERLHPVIVSGDRGEREGRKGFRVTNAGDLFHIDVCCGLANQPSCNALLSRIELRKDEHYAEADVVDFVVGINLIQRGRGEVQVEILGNGHLVTPQEFALPQFGSDWSISNENDASSHQ